MSQTSHAAILAQAAESEPHPRINVGLTDGNRISLVNWVVSGDCLIEQWPNGAARYVIPLAQIVILEFPDAG